MTAIVGDTSSASVSRTTTYDPASQGYRYFWTTGRDRTQSTTTTYGQASWLGIDAFAADPANVTDGPHVTFSTPRPLAQGSYVAYAPGGPDYAYSFQRIAAQSNFDPTKVSGTWIDLGTNNHVWSVDDGITYSTNGHGNIGLTDGGQYYIVTVSNDNTKVRLSSARGGTPITFTAAGRIGVIEDLNGTPNTETIDHWSESTWYGTTTYYIKERTWIDQKDVHTHSIKADRTINISFIGYDAGQAQVNVTSTGDILLNGPINDSHGTTSLNSTGGAIRVLGDTAVVGGQVISMNALTGIGADLAVQTVLTSGLGGFLNAVTTLGSIRVTELAGDLTIGQVTTSNSAGDVTLNAPQGSILAYDASSLIRGGSITLNSGTGSIGTLGSGGTAAAPGGGALAIRVDTGNDSVRDLLNGTASGNIFVPAGAARGGNPGLLALGAARGCRRADR